MGWGGEGKERVKGRARMDEGGEGRGGEGRGGEGRGGEGRGVCMKPCTHCTHARTTHTTHPHYTSLLTNELVHLVRVARVVRHKEGPTQDGKRLLSKGSSEEAQLVQQAAQGLREGRGGEGRRGEGRGEGREGEGRGGEGGGEGRRGEGRGGEGREGRGVHYKANPDQVDHGTHTVTSPSQTPSTFTHTYPYHLLHTSSSTCHPSNPPRRNTPPSSE